MSSLESFACFKSHEGCWCSLLKAHCFYFSCLGVELICNWICVWYKVGVKILSFFLPKVILLECPSFPYCISVTLSYIKRTVYLWVCFWTLVIDLLIYLSDLEVLFLQLCSSPRLFWLFLNFYLKFKNHKWPQFSFCKTY